MLYSVYVKKIMNEKLPFSHKNKNNIAARMLGWFGSILKCTPVGSF